MGKEVKKHKLDAEFIRGLTKADRPYRVWDTDIAGYFIQVATTGSKTYRLRYKVNGIAKEYTLGKHGKLTAKTARELADTKAAEVTLGADIQLEKKQAKQQAQADKHNTLGGFIQKKYEPWITTERKTGEEIVKLLTSKFGHLYSKSLMEVTPWDIQKWRTEGKKKGLKPATLNRQISLLKSVFSRAVDWGVIPVNPLASVKPMRLDAKTVVRYLSEEEEQSLRQALGDRDQELKSSRENANEWRRVRHLEPFPSLMGKAYADYLEPIVLLALNTGMRRGEILGLEWSEVDLKKRNVTVKGEGAKSGSTRHIPLNDEGFSVLDAWKKQTSGKGIVFPSPVTGERMGNIKKSWGSVIKKAGVKGFRFHDLRHTFASKLVMATVDLNTVRELLGHASIDMTLRYAHLAPEHKAAAVALLVN